MELKFNDIVEFLKANGNKQVVGIGNNTRVVYEWIKKTSDGPQLFSYGFCIKPDGLEAKYYHTDHVNVIRYNETTNCIQSRRTSFGTFNGRYNYTWDTLKFNENGRILYWGDECLVFDSTSDAIDYLNVYYQNNIQKAKKILNKNIKHAKTVIKDGQRDLKKYEKALAKIENNE